MFEKFPYIGTKQNNFCFEERVMSLDYDDKEITSDHDVESQFGDEEDTDAVNSDQINATQPVNTTESKLDNTKSDLREFIHLCEQIKAAKNELKVLVDRKAELETNISQFMLSHEIQHFETPNGKISLVESKTVKPLSKDYLRDTISSKISDPTIVNELTSLAFAKRPSKTISKIKISKKKSS
jgi:hypothetical protein